MTDLSWATIGAIIKVIAGALGDYHKLSSGSRTRGLNHHGSGKDARLGFYVQRDELGSFRIHKFSRHQRYLPSRRH